MELNNRLSTISYLLDIALDSEEEYLYHGEMSDYMRTYAGDAADRLDSLFRPGGPTEPAEIDLCVQALSDPERLKRGRSKELLLGLRERSRPIIEALSNSPDPRLRIFALETGGTSVNPFFHSPLYGTIDINRKLLEDPDENVRAAALTTVHQTMVHNASYIESGIQRGVSLPLLDLLSQIASHLDDPSSQVRAEVENVLRCWALKVGRETVEMFLDRENNPAAREVLSKDRPPGDPTVKGGQPALNDDHREG